MPVAYAPLPLLQFEQPPQIILDLGEQTRLHPAESRDLPSSVVRLIGSEHERSLRGVRSWVMTSFDEESQHALSWALQRVHLVVRAIQVIVPIGADPNLAWAEYGTEPTLQTWHKRSTWYEPTWARLYRISAKDIQDIPHMVRQVGDTEINKSRLRNPLAFLEHALISNHSMIRGLMFVVGLDALLMAGNQQTFEKRLIKLLGGDSRALPRIGYLGRHPSYTVADVARDVYQLRSELAHGRILSANLRASRPLVDCEGQPSFVELEYPYFQILSEAASSMLCRAIRSILLSEELRSVFESEKRWRAFLASP